MTTTHHDESLRDRAAMLAMRGVVALQPKLVFGPEARPGFDALMAGTPAADGVDSRPDVVGGVPGWWCRPAGAPDDAAILYLHGGAFVLGSAAAYRNLVGQIATRAGIAAFVADYALAPERPFPAAFEDAQAAYHGLRETGHGTIVLAGDSAGGGLALSLLAALCADDGLASKPAAAVVLSPWADMTLSGDSMNSRAEVDPLLSRAQLAQAARLYLGDADPRDRRASMLSGPADRLPPVQVHVGDDEVLLYDAVRLEAAATRAGGSVDLHVWRGMVHVFPANLAMLAAAEAALDAVGAFISAHRGAPA